MKTTVHMLFCIFSLLFYFTGFSQFSDNFNDGDFSGNPAWAGGINDWTVNPLLQLQSNNTQANSVFYLSTASNLATTAQWEFNCRLGFNPSSVNYIDAYLTASASDLTIAALTGYFIRLGGPDDDISLYRRDMGSVTRIIDGVNGSLNSSNNDVGIKVARDAANRWQLLRNINHTGFINEGFAPDDTYLSSAFFGFVVKQSTASFFQKHFFDDIVAGPYIPDLQPPVIQSYDTRASNLLDILFNEPVDPASCQPVLNYQVNNGVGYPISAVRDTINEAMVHLTFPVSFPSRLNLELTINGIKDISGNAISNGKVTFSFFTAVSFDVVIDEIMADPSPPNALPDAEWVELLNTTSFNIDLRGFRIGKPSGLSGPLPSYILKPDSFVVVCPVSALAELSAFTPAIAVPAFPGLNNTGDLLYLLSPQDVQLHAVNYTDHWYRNELKKSGGWSLEMTDSHNPCTGSNNWNASEDASGGTPGRLNSTNEVNADRAGPKLLRAYATDSLNIVLVFDEPLDSITASLVSAYQVGEGNTHPESVTPLPFLFDRVNIRLPGTVPLQRNKVYTITVNGLTDCVGNSVGSFNTARAGLYENADSLDITLNEILFNPGPGGNDYVEIYNRSKRILNMKYCYMASRNTAGVISNISQLSKEDYLVFPGDYLVITENKALVLRDYIAEFPDAFIENAGMPSLNDDKGNVLLLNEQGNIIDEVAYSGTWHFKLITEDEGVSLERIDCNAPSQDGQNWHSAAASVGFGTPTYKNSQVKQEYEVKGDITVTPEIISPDNDGQDDFALVSYRFPLPGYIAGITVFDASGRLVRYLQRNAICGTSGYFNWDGLDEQARSLLPGIYIIYTEIINLEGKHKKFRHAIVVAKK